jgi:hypothetical protein
MADKEDPNLEVYKSLTALYIQVDESVMTRHKFFLTIVIAIFTAIGLLIYQLDNCNFPKTIILISIALVLGAAISVAWLLISYRGLFIDKEVSNQLELLETELNIYPAFTNYNRKLLEKGDICTWYEHIRMEHIHKGLTWVCLAIFFVIIFVTIIRRNDLKDDLGTNGKCVLNVQNFSSETCPTAGKTNFVTEDKEKINGSPINNNITINIPSDKDNNTKTTPPNCTDDCCPNS